MAERGKSEPDDHEDSPDTKVYLNYPLKYVAQTWMEHRQRGTYPETGAYNDQDAALMDDWHSLDMKFIGIEGRLKREQRETPDYPDQAKDWMSLL